MTQQTISVIVPCFNQAHYLNNAIESLLVQTRRPNEIIIVNDGSTDNTAEVAGRYGSPIILINQANMGISGALNTGYRAATSDLVTVLASDDTLEPSSLEKRMKLLETHPEWRVVYSDVAFMNDTGELLGRYSQMMPELQPSGNVFGVLARYNLMPFHAFLFRRECLEKCGYFDETLHWMEDYEFLLRLASHYDFYYLDEPLANYRVHAGQTTQTHWQRMRTNDLRVHERVFSMAAFAQLSPLERARAYSTHGTRCAQLGEMADARRWYQQAQQEAPAWKMPLLLRWLTYTGEHNFRRVVDVIARLRATRSPLTS
ncbi:MAG TPA: glycosyltransferase [Aggregatilineales bacterium]|nr:glycosyltransferase [Aggregatilineales bacterium]